jgi:phage shock protein A
MRHVVAEYEDALVGLRRENEARRRTLGELEVAIASLEAQLADVRAESAERAALIESLQRRVDTELPAAVAEAERLRRRIATIEASTGYRLANGATRRMGWLKGGGGSSS